MLQSQAPKRAHKKSENTFVVQCADGRTLIRKYKLGEKIPFKFNEAGEVVSRFCRQCKQEVPIQGWTFRTRGRRSVATEGDPHCSMYSICTDCYNDYGLIKHQKYRVRNGIKLRPSIEKRLVRLHNGTLGLHCNSCKLVKSIVEFRIKPGDDIPYRGICKDCCNEQRRERLRKERIRLIKEGKLTPRSEWRNSPKHAWRYKNDLIFSGGGATCASIQDLSSSALSGMPS